MQNLQILQTIATLATLATPLLILLIGSLINRKLELAKQTYTKEKDWQVKWADAFYVTATSFNAAVEDSMMSLFEIAQYEKSKIEKKDTLINEKLNSYRLAIEKIQRTEWSLKTHMHFAPQNSSAVLNAALEIIKLSRSFFENQGGDLEQMRSLLFQFNVSAKKAHKELLHV
jgi:hypothetical protein